MATVIWMNTSKPSKAMAPAMVTCGPWVLTWSHWNSAATKAAIDTVEATSVPAPTPRILRNRDDSTIRARAPPIMISMGRMLK